MKIGWILLLVTGLCVSPSILFAQNKNREIGSFPQPVDTSKFAYKNKLLIFPIIAFSPETNWVFSIFNAYIFKTSKKALLTLDKEKVINLELAMLVKALKD